MLKKKIKKIVLPTITPYIPQLKRLERKILERGIRSPLRGRQPSLNQKITFVVATYNVEKYFNDFMLSIVNQSTGLHNLEVIIINDGSTDNTEKIVQKWIRAYPNLIKYTSQENQGVAAARNTGILQATGEWVSFPDPDDILDRHYLHYVNTIISKKREKPLGFLATRILLYYETTGQTSFGHPLNYKFQKDYTELNGNDLRDFMHLSGGTAFLKLSLLREANLLFDPKIVPMFEDGVLINLYLNSLDGYSAGFVRKAKYIYRQRADQSSLVSGAKFKSEAYLDQLIHGNLELLKKTAKKNR